MKKRGWSWLLRVYNYYKSPLPFHLASQCPLHHSVGSQSSASLHFEIHIARNEQWHNMVKVSTCISGSIASSKQLSLWITQLPLQMVFVHLHHPYAWKMMPVACTVRKSTKTPSFQVYKGQGALPSALQGTLKFKLCSAGRDVFLHSSSLQGSCIATGW